MDPYDGQYPDKLFSDPSLGWVELRLGNFGRPTTSYCTGRVELEF